jgi:hypothetical protein
MGCSVHVPFQLAHRFTVDDNNRTKSVKIQSNSLDVVDRDGKIVLEARTPTAPKAIAAALAKAPSVERVLFETGRMAPALFHGLTALGVPALPPEIGDRDELPGGA